MKLITLAQSGETLPPSLPSSLIPPSKVKTPVSSTATVTKSSASAGVQPSLATTSLAGSSGSGTNSPMLTPSPVPQSSPLPAKKQQVIILTKSDKLNTAMFMCKPDFRKSFFKGKNFN